MLNINSKYYKNIIQLWLFKAVLFFSVWAFSGFNGYTSSNHLEPVRTELVTTKNHGTLSRLFKFRKSIYKLETTRFLLGLSSYTSSWALLNFNHSIIIQYKSICKKSLSFKRMLPILSTKILFPSSKEEIPLFPLFKSFKLYNRYKL